MKPRVKAKLVHGVLKPVKREAGVLFCFVSLALGHVGSQFPD